MNILFLISNDGGNGVGGHFTSLNQVSREVAKQHNVKIISLGSAPSPIIEPNPYFEKHIYTSRGGFKTIADLNSEFAKLKETFVPHLIHCFDTESLNKTLILPAFYKLPVVLNKCGGRNPIKSDYQHADAIVAFSSENKDWFANNSNYNKNDIFLIPNRVQKLNFLDPALQKEIKDTGKITFVRVSRLGGAYEKTLRDTYNLIEKLSAKYPVQLIVVGRIQDKERFEKLVREAESRNLPVKFITDERASKGSDFLYLADFVIGTGRSFMEATSLGIPSLTPADNSDLPVLIHPGNFEFFFSTNFSERNIADDLSLKGNLDNVESLITDIDKYHLAQKQTREIFEENFGTDQILTKYNAVYDYALKKKKGRSRLIRKNLKYLIKFLISK